MAGSLCKGLFILAGFLCVVGIVLVVVGSHNQFVEKVNILSFSHLFRCHLFTY